MSYHSPFPWSDEQDAGFREALAGVEIEHRVFRLDAQRNRAKSWAEEKGREARALIEAWKPDLVYASDDDAQEHVARHYVNTALPIVFSGVDRDPAAYGYAGAKNVAGVPEQIHVAESMRLLQAVAPGARRILMVSDAGEHWKVVVDKIRAGALTANAEVVAWKVVHSAEEYQRAVREAPGMADAIWPLGLNGLKDARGKV